MKGHRLTLRNIIINSPIELVSVSAVRVFLRMFILKLSGSIFMRPFRRTVFLVSESKVVAFVLSNSFAFILHKSCRVHP